MALLWNSLLIAEERVASLDVARAWQALAPDEPEANFALGSALLSQESVTGLHYQEALLFLNRALSQNPRSLAARGFLAVALAGTQRVNESIRTMRDALALAPEEDKAALHMLLGIFLMRVQVEAKAEVSGLRGPEGSRGALGDGGAPRVWTSPSAVCTTSWPCTPRLSCVGPRSCRRPSEQWLSTPMRFLPLRDPGAGPDLAGEIAEAMKTLDGVDALEHVCPRSLMIRACALSSLGRLEEAPRTCSGSKASNSIMGLPDVNLASYNAKSARILDALGRYEDAIDLLQEAMRAGTRKVRLSRAPGASPSACRVPAPGLSAKVSVRSSSNSPTSEPSRPTRPRTHRPPGRWGRRGGSFDTLAQARKRFLRSFPGRPGDLYGMYLAGVGNALVIFQANATDARGRRCGVAESAAALRPGPPMPRLAEELRR